MGHNAIVTGACEDAGLIAYYSDSEADRKVCVLEAKIAFLRDNCPMPQAAREKLTITHLECALMSDQGHYPKE